MYNKESTSTRRPREITKLINTLFNLSWVLFKQASTSIIDFYIVKFSILNIIQFFILWVIFFSLLSYDILGHCSLKLILFQEIALKLVFQQCIHEKTLQHVHNRINNKNQHRHFVQSQGCCANKRLKKRTRHTTKRSTQYWKAFDVNC